MKKLFLPMLSKTLNVYLGLDPESEKRLKKLQGQVMTVELLPFHFVFQLAINEGEMTLHSNENLEANVRITGTPLQMLGVALNKTDRHRFFADDLKIEGNAELGQHVIALFDELELDWEEYLSQLVGDVPTYHAGRILRGAGKWFSRAKQSLVDNMNEYVHEEAAWFPPSEALKDFYHDIDQLRMDMDRLEAKVRHLLARAKEEDNNQ